jgi:hypothetical protein
MEVALSSVPGPYGRYRKMSWVDKNVSGMVEGMRDIWGEEKWTELG